MRLKSKVIGDLWDPERILSVLVVGVDGLGGASVRTFSGRKLG